MTKPLVKICGITNTEDALFCAQLGADAVGFNFYVRSPRFIEPSKAAIIASRLPAGVRKVGVFVNAGRTLIERIVRNVGLDVIQLSGDEPPEECLGHEAEVWKAFRIADAAGVDSARQYAIGAALLDGAPAGTFGGSGRRADPAVAGRLKEHHRVILAGGLDPGNIREAVREVEPYGVDVNSGVEIAPGKKDVRKVALLFERLRTLETPC